MDSFNRMSVATIDSPEFVNINSISPLVSKCEVKVLYVGQNRNRSYITKEVAMEMAQTLPGVPIVGYFIENKEDFGDHGEQVIIDAEGVKFNKLTKPYGFVAPDSKIWFQKFEDTDEFGNVEVREYLMTEGYLWTEQYEECKRVVDNGNPQSMELDEKTLKGHWSMDNNRGVEFFIINDAIFSKLCILGEDVEPCFEGAKVTAPEVSANFSKDESFTKTLYSMIEELKYTLSNIEKEGGLPMSLVDEEVKEVNTTENFSNEEDKNNEQPSADFENIAEGNTEDSDNSSDSVVEADPTPEADFEKKEDEKEEDKKEDDSKEDSSEEDKKEDSKEEDDKEEDKKKYELLQAEHEELQANFSLLEKEIEELRAFKAEIDNEKKDELIQSFYMLSDEDKKDVIENKATYSLEDIEAKLSVICFRKKVDFNLNDDKEEEQTMDAPTTYNLDADSDVSLPAWVKAVMANEN